ncbi:hypothetical protein [Streptomyces sp. NPDC002187]
MRASRLVALLLLLQDEAGPALTVSPLAWAGFLSLAADPQP